MQNSSHPTLFTSRSTSTPTTPRDVTTNTATSMWGPLPSTFPSQRALPKSQTQATFSQHTHISRTFTTLLALYRHHHPLLHDPHRQLSRLRPSLDPRTPLLYISQWQPTLNWPFISQHLKLKADGWQFSRHRAHFSQPLQALSRITKTPPHHQATHTAPLTQTPPRPHHTPLSLPKHLTTPPLACGPADTRTEVYAIRRVATSLEESTSHSSFPGARHFPTQHSTVAHHLTPPAQTSCHPTSPSHMQTSRSSSQHAQQPTPQPPALGTIIPATYS